MSKTVTIFVDLERLRDSGSRASVIIQLMMACNDVSLANQCLSKFREEPPRMRKHVQTGALMYFVLLQCGHLNEAMKIIQEIKSDPYLCDRIKRCSPKAQESFDKLAKCLKGGSNYQKFQKYIGQIRHNTVFHYSKKLIERALSDSCNWPETSRSKITGGSNISYWRFELADGIVDNITCRQIWKIPRNAVLREEADRIEDFGSDLGKSLLSFGGESVFRYIQEHAAA